MTREQMISTLRGMDFGSTIGSKGDEALRMAIAELEQEPCDTISREKVADALTELVEMIDTGSQRDLDRADELSRQIMSAIKPCDDAISSTKLLAKIDLEMCRDVNCWNCPFRSKELIDMKLYTHCKLRKAIRESKYE